MVNTTIENLNNRNIDIKYKFQKSETEHISCGILKK